LDSTDKIKETIDRREARAIIEYIKEYPDTTMDAIVEALKKETIASRVTTLSIIEKLIGLGIIIDDRKGTYSHRLRYNENYNWLNLAMTLLTDYLDDVKNAIYGISKDDEIKYEIQKIMDKLKVREVEPRVMNEKIPLVMANEMIEKKIEMKAGKPSTKTQYSYAATKPRRKRKKV